MSTRHPIVTLFLLWLGLAAATVTARAQDCNVADQVTYRLTFDATWSAQTLPQQFPASAHFSGLVGGTHDAGVSFWQPGGTASAGIESMAETGSKSALLSEVNAAINAGTAFATVSGGSVGVSPGTAVATFDLDQAHPLATVVTMIAPSPDWFVGVSGLPLFADGNWLAEVAVNLYGYDSGTDSGATYTSANQDTQPQEPIAQLDGPLFMNGGMLAPFGRFTFERLTDSCLDSDGDTVPDEDDNCVLAANEDQTDADGDGFGNACDADLNNDCIVNAQDLGILKAVFFSADPVADLNADGVVNVLDLGVLKQGFFAAPGPSSSGAICLP